MPYQLKDALSAERMLYKLIRCLISWKDALSAEKMPYKLIRCLISWKDALSAEKIPYQLKRCLFLAEKSSVRPIAAIWAVLEHFVLWNIHWATFPQKYTTAHRLSLLQILLRIRYLFSHCLRTWWKAGFPERWLFSHLFPNVQEYGLKSLQASSRSYFQNLGQSTFLELLSQISGEKFIF
jgi:hypothetical protein